MNENEPKKQEVVSCATCKNKPTCKILCKEIENVLHGEGIFNADYFGKEVSSNDRAKGKSKWREITGLDLKLKNATEGLTQKDPLGGRKHKKEKRSDTFNENEQEGMKEAPMRKVDSGTEDWLTGWGEFSPYREKREKVVNGYKPIVEDEPLNESEDKEE